MNMVEYAALWHDGNLLLAHSQWFVLGLHGSGIRSENPDIRIETMIRLIRWTALKNLTYCPNCGYELAKTHCRIVYMPDKNLLCC